MPYDNTVSNSSQASTTSTAGAPNIQAVNDLSLTVTALVGDVWLWVGYNAPAPGTIYDTEALAFPEQGSFPPSGSGLAAAITTGTTQVTDEWPGYFLIRAGNTRTLTVKGGYLVQVRAPSDADDPSIFSWWTSAL